MYPVQQLAKIWLNLYKSQTGGKGIVKTSTVMRKRKELNKNIGSKSLHHFVQRLLVQSIRQQVAKPLVLMRSLQNCSKQEERRYWTECTEYVWRSGKLSGHRNGRSPHSSHFPSKVILNSVQITEQLFLSPMQARSFFGSYWKGSEWRPKCKLHMNRRDSDKEEGEEIKSRISKYWCTRQANTNNQSICALWTSRRRSTLISHDKLWVTMMDIAYPVHLIDLLAKLYRKQLAKVKVAGTLSEWFCPIRLCLFSVFVQHHSGDGKEGWISKWTANWRANDHKP